MDPLATVRAELERVLTLTAEQHHQLDQREAELAAAMELLAVDPRIIAAFNDGAAETRHRVQLLIATQLSHLRPCSSTALVLRKLSDLVGN